TIGKAVKAVFLIAPKPLVAGLPAHPEPAAQRRKTPLLLLNRHHKAHPLVHGTGLRPSHRQGPPRRSVDLLPMSPVYSVTHVAGLDRRTPSPRRGEGRGEGGRRALFSILVQLLAAALAMSLAHAETDYPSRPVRIIVGFGPGAVADTPARLLAQKFSQS